MTQPQSLKRHIGPFALLLTGVTGVIGSAWLFAAMYAAQIAGPAAIISWLIGGAVAFLFALIYAEISGMLPVPGALARIPFLTHGSLAGFSSSWLVWAGYVVVAPLEVTAVLDYASNYYPELTYTAQGDRLLTLEGVLIAAALMLIFTVINTVGVRWMTRTNSVITIWKLIIPISAAIALIWVGLRPENFTEYGGFAPHGLAGIFGAVSGGGVIFGYFGFRSVLDLAGEAKNPHRNVPMALLGTLLICLVLYVVLQIAFVGVIPPDQLANGWGAIASNLPGGPFAAFAVMLGLPLVAYALYFDAALSPSGTALVYIGTTARVNYAMARNGHLPKLFEKINRFNVPGWGLLINFLIGMILFLPFPSWNKLVQFASSAILLSMIFGPASFLALRSQVPEMARSIRLPWGKIMAPIAFTCAGFVVFWAGWETTMRVILLLLLGVGLMFLMQFLRKELAGPLHAKSSIWVWIYIAGIGLISFLGTYGGGLGVLPEGIAMALIAILSIAMSWLAHKQRLPDEEARQLIESEMVVG